MTEVTRCDRLTRVHNGRIPIIAQLYLRNSKLTYRTSSLSKARSGMTLPSSYSLDSVRFLSVGFRGFRLRRENSLRLSLRPASAFSSLRFYSRESSSSTKFLGVVFLQRFR